jgi:alkaline phosphatase D
MSFVWSGDTAGQGWGIDESRGESKLLRRATMARRAAVTLKDSEDRSLWSTVIAPKGAKIAAFIAISALPGCGAATI